MRPSLVGVNTMPSPSGRSSTIARNAVWVGLETGSEAIVFLACSVAVARTLGPDKLGNYIFLIFVTGIANRLGAFGLAAATRKFMSELLGKGETALARAVYFRTLLLQAIFAVATAAIASVFVTLYSRPGYESPGYILTLAIIPSLLSAIPANANQAREDMGANSRSAMIYTALYGLVISATLYCSWGVAGLAMATLLGRCGEMAMRLLSARQWISKLDRGGQVPQAIAAQMSQFCRQSLALTLVSLVVAEKSEFVFLRLFGSANQLAFYSVGFGVADRLLTVGRVFTGSATTSLLAQHSSAVAGLQGLFQNTVIYLALFAFPLHLAVAALGQPLVHIAYGRSFEGAIPVLMIACVLGIFKAFQPIPDILFQAADRQTFMVKWLIGISILNLLLDWALIPRFGAIGAAWGNGLSQSIAVVGLWVKVHPVCGLRTPYQRLTKLVLISGAPALAVVFVNRLLNGVAALVFGCVLYLFVFVLLARFTQALTPAEMARLEALGAWFARPVRLAVRRRFSILFARL